MLPFRQGLPHARHVVGRLRNNVGILRPTADICPGQSGTRLRILLIDDEDQGAFGADLGALDPATVNDLTGFGAHPA